MSEPDYAPTPLQLYGMLLGRDALMAKILALVAGEPTAELWNEVTDKLDKDILFNNLLHKLEGNDD